LDRLHNAGMSITYANDPSQRIVHESWRGDVHAADIREFWTRMLADPVSLSIRRSLADVREAVPQLTAEELERAVDDVLIPGLGERSWISAAVVATADQLRLTHRYRATQRLSEVSVFSDPDVALKWLRRQELPT
jgi:hypothetical protein